MKKKFKAGSEVLVLTITQTFAYKQDLTKIKFLNNRRSTF